MPLQVQANLQQVPTLPENQKSHETTEETAKGLESCCVPPYGYHAGGVANTSSQSGVHVIESGPVLRLGPTGPVLSTIPFPAPDAHPPEPWLAPFRRSGRASMASLSICLCPNKQTGPPSYASQSIREVSASAFRGRL